MICNECDYFYKICGIGRCSMTDGETSPKDSCELGISKEENALKNEIDRKMHYYGDRKDLTESTFGKTTGELLREMNPLEKIGYEQLSKTDTNKEWWVKHNDFFSEIIIKQSGNLRLDIPPEHLQPIMEYLRLDNEIENLKEEIRSKDYEIDCLNKDVHYWINTYNEQVRKEDREHTVIGKIRDLMEVEE